MCSKERSARNGAKPCWAGEVGSCFSVCDQKRESPMKAHHTGKRPHVLGVSAPGLLIVLLVGACAPAVLPGGRRSVENPWARLRHQTAWVALGDLDASTGEWATGIVHAVRGETTETARVPRHAADSNRTRRLRHALGSRSGLRMPRSSVPSSGGNSTRSFRSSTLSPAAVAVTRSPSGAPDRSPPSGAPSTASSIPH